MILRAQRRSTCQVRTCVENGTVLTRRPYCTSKFLILSELFINYTMIKANNGGSDFRMFLMRTMKEILICKRI